MSAKNGKRAHGHRFTADEKVKVLEEARQPGTTVAEVLRRYQIDGTTFYRWEKEAKAAVRDALGGKPRGGDARTRELERESSSARTRGSERSWTGSGRSLPKSSRRTSR